MRKLITLIFITATLISNTTLAGSVNSYNKKIKNKIITENSALILLKDAINCYISDSTLFSLESYLVDTNGIGYIRWTDDEYIYARYNEHLTKKQMIYEIYFYFSKLKRDIKNCKLTYVLNVPQNDPSYSDMPGFTVTIQVKSNKLFYSEINFTFLDGKIIALFVRNTNEEKINPIDLKLKTIK